MGTLMSPASGATVPLTQKLAHFMPLAADEIPLLRDLQAGSRLFRRGQELIVEGKTSQIEKVIASSSDFYQMQSFNQSLAKLTLSGTITQEEALACSTNPNDLKLMLKGIGSASAAKPPEPPKMPIRKGF